MRANALSATHQPTLLAALWPQGQASRIVRFVVLAIIGSLLLTVSAKVKVPFYPVPMTLQTLAVALIAASCGARLATATVLLYIAEGIAGLPVFTNTPPAVANFAYLLGPTGGYLAGFVLAAFVIGSLADRGWTRSFPRLVALMVLGDAIILTCGSLWLASFAVMASGTAGIGLAKALEVGVYPFLLSAAVKEALGVAIITGAWTLVPRREIG
jgi:biotin transport system substrate-specific component